MRDKQVGADLLRLMEAATGDVLLAAPFMKAATVAQILDRIGDRVTLLCYTRWRPEEIAAGVSDLEVADLVSARPHSELFLVGDLHAKLYCADRRCLVTSANLTGSALGWRSPANLEIGVELSRDHPEVRHLESRLLQLAVPATIEIRAAVAAAASEIPKTLVSSRLEGHDDSRGRSSKPFSSWIPSSLLPMELFALYEGYDQHISQEAAHDAYRDLEFLNLPQGLTNKAFRQSIRSLLLQHPILSTLALRAGTAAVSERNADQYFDNAIGEYLESHAEAFRISARWLAYFFSDRLLLRHDAGEDILESRSVHYS